MEQTKMTTEEFLFWFRGSIFGFIHDPDAARKPRREMREFNRDSFLSFQRENYGIYFTPNAMGDMKNPNGVFYRWDGNVNRLNACFADLDEGTKEEQMVKINGLLTSPTLIVESKRGYHLYWLLPEIMATKETVALWRGIQRTIAGMMGADVACSNPSRLLRLPGFNHLKDPNDPFLVNVISVSDRLYRLEDLELAFPPPPKPKTFELSASRFPLKVPPFEALTKGNRHSRLAQVGGRMYWRRPPEEYQTVRETLKAWWIGSCLELDATWEKEFEGFVRWIERKNDYSTHG